MSQLPKSAECSGKMRSGLGHHEAESGKHESQMGGTFKNAHEQLRGYPPAPQYGT